MSPNNSNQGGSASNKKSKKGSQSSSGTLPNDGINLGSGLTNLSIGDDEQVEVRANGTAYSTTTDTRQARGFYTPPFVRNGAGSSSSPFTSPATHGPSASGLKIHAMNSNNWRTPGYTPPTPPAPTKRKSTGFLGSQTSSSSGFNAELGNRITQNSSGWQSTSTGSSFDAQPRHAIMQNISHPSSGPRSCDPQALFPVSSAVFVGNLPQGHTDSSIEVAVTQAFREYGHVYVKIKRDRKNMPLGFLQYRIDEDAKRAIAEGSSIKIGGRDCRVEPGRANLEYYIERLDGRAITPVEARLILRVFGQLVDAHFPSSTERMNLNVGDGVIVKFAFYENGIAAHNHFRNSDRYKMQPIHSLKKGSVSSTYNATSSDEQAFLRAHELDGRSIHVANLPVGVTEAELRQLFSPFGIILNVETRQFTSRFGPSVARVFAFIEFQDDRSPVAAINGMHGHMFDDRVIRVTHRKSEIRPQSQVASRGSGMSSGISRRAQSGGSVFQTPPSTTAPLPYMMPTPPASVGPAVWGAPASMQAQQAPPSYGASASATQGFAMPQHPVQGSLVACYYDPMSGAMFSSSPLQTSYSGTGSYGYASTSPTLSFPPYGAANGAAYGAPYAPVYPPQSFGYGGFGVPAYNNQAFTTGQPVYPSQFPSGPIYSTPAAAQAAANSAANAHAHPQTAQDDTVTLASAAHSNEASEVDESG